MSDFFEPIYKQAGWTPLGGFPYAKMAFGLEAGMFLWESYLELRRYRKLQETEVDNSLLMVVREIDQQKEGSDLEKKVKEKFDSSQAYGRDKAKFSQFKRTFDFFQSVTFFKLGYGPFLWDCAGSIIQSAFGLDPVTSVISRSLAYCALEMGVGTVIGLPFDWYRHYVLEEKHGFNKMTYRTWITDQLKALGLSCVLGGPLLAAFLKVVSMGSIQQLAFRATGFSMAASFFFMAIYPDFIAPLFNDFKPLEEGSLRTKIEDLAVQLKFPLKKLFVMDGSQRSAHSNAYFFGFGSNKRIVLFDTLIEQAEEDEIVAILGHEIGHWEFMHVWKGLVMSQIELFALIHGCAQLITAPGMYRQWGFVDQPFMIGLGHFSESVWSPISILTGALRMWNSRRNEFQADAYSAGLNHAAPLSRGLVKLQLENLSEFSVDPLFAAWHYTHPTLIERVSALRAEDSKAKKD